MDTDIDVVRQPHWVEMNQMSVKTWYYIRSRKRHTVVPSSFDSVHIPMLDIIYMMISTKRFVILHQEMPVHY